MTSQPHHLPGAPAGYGWSPTANGVGGSAQGGERLPIEVGSQRHLFEVPEAVAYFNTANMSPLLRAVREAGESGLARRSAPWLVAAADWFGDVERLRALYAAVLGADSDGVSLVPATSYGLAIAARNVVAMTRSRAYCSRCIPLE
jgi:kynureninase